MDFSKDDCFRERVAKIPISRTPNGLSVLYFVDGGAMRIFSTYKIRFPDIRRLLLSVRRSKSNKLRKSGASIVGKSG